MPHVPSNELTTGESSEQSNARTHKFALSDIYEKTEEASSMSDVQSAESRGTQEEVHRSMPSPSKGADYQDSSVLEEQGSLRDMSFANQEKEKTSSMITDSGPPNTGYRADAGTDLPSGRTSEASSVPTYTNLVVMLFFLYMFQFQ